MPARPKYRNRKTIADGRVFDSKREANRWALLRIQQRDGVIFDLRRQVEYELVPKQVGERPVKYVADFVYVTRAGTVVVEDVKGVKTRDYVIKRKLMLWRHGIRIVEV